MTSIWWVPIRIAPSPTHADGTGAADHFLLQGTLRPRVLLASPFPSLVLVLFSSEVSPVPEGSSPCQSSSLPRSEPPVSL